MSKTSLLFLYLLYTGRSSLFPIDDGLLDDGHGNQGVFGSGYPHQNGDRMERFSRKVFVGGLPPDIDEGRNSDGRQSSMFFTTVSLG